jgi:hypothetical protein
MKKFSAVIAVTALMVSPVFAKPAARYGDMVRSPQSLMSAPSRDFVDGDYIGHDPDPRIESGLVRDPPAVR